jgi:hypothetical protein
MPSTHRVSHFGLLALASLLACARSEAPPPALSQATPRVAPTFATFEGSFEPGKGLTIKTTPMAASGVVGRYVATDPYQDGLPGTGPVDTFELVTDASPAPGTDANGCGSGLVDYHGSITLRSFYKTQAFTDVAIELTSVSTGYEACNSVAAYGGMSGSYGLWDYLGIGVAGSATDHASQPWKFHFGGGQAFTFRGRIMAQAGALPIPPSGAAEFDWRPYMFNDPPHSFQETGTTISHVIWNGTGFIDTKGVANFQPVAATNAIDHAVGLAYPAQHWVGPFASGADRYEASPTPAALNFTGDFTVCAKFKPGANPLEGGRKVLVAKGNPVDLAGAGWALTQQHGTGPTSGPQYGFFYVTLNNGNTDTFVFPGNNPENSTFDYSCAGRSGNSILVVAHGRDVHFANTVTGTFPDVAALPLVIGAAAGGSWPATDAGVYEVIFDSRAATLEVMNGIVDGAEGQQTRNGASYYGNNVDALPVTGADGAVYHFPFGSTAPVSSDGSGLLDAGMLLAFGGTTAFQAPVLPGSPGAFCVGVEVASANWAGASGCVLGDVDGYLKIFFQGTEIGATTGNQWRALGGNMSSWAANSRHTLLVCTPDPSLNVATLYVDGTSVGSTDASGGPQFNLTTGQLLVGTCYSGNLTGARIGRVFACPTSDHMACQ